MKTSVPVPAKSITLQVFHAYMKVIRTTKWRIRRHYAWWFTRYPVFMGLSFFASQLFQTNDPRPILSFAAAGTLILFNKRPWGKLVRYPFGAFLSGFTAVFLMEMAYGPHNRWLLFNPGYVKVNETAYQLARHIDDHSPKEIAIASKDLLITKVKETKALAVNTLTNFGEFAYNFAMGDKAVSLKNDMLEFYYSVFRNSQFNKQVLLAQDEKKTQNLASYTPTKEDIEDPINVSSFLKGPVSPDLNQEHENYSFIENISQRDYDADSRSKRITGFISGIRAAGRAWLNPSVPDSIHRVKERVKNYSHEDPQYQVKDYKSKEENIETEKTLSPPYYAASHKKGDCQDTKTTARDQLFNSIGDIFSRK